MLEFAPMKLEITNVLERAPLEFSEALHMMYSLAQALSELHAAGELWDHCEVGIEIFPNGISTIRGTISDRNARLAEGDVDPNRAIVPPEYLTSGIHDQRSDIFAWGVIVYELITGMCPLQGETIVELLKAAEECNFTPPHHIIEEWPERLSLIVIKALSKDPLDRFQTANELLLALNTR